MCFKACLLFLFVYDALTNVKGCGVTTHMLISERGKEFFNGKGKTVDYQSLIYHHNDAFQAGSAFPDSFYSHRCFGGNYSQVSEDTHWTPFLNASINYIRNNYPQPWNDATEKLVVFLFGIMSHQVSDVVWHSLGIEQGFIQALAAVDFHGNYSTAHEAADFGGDILAYFNMDAVELINPNNEWYVPTQELYNIYKEYYGKEKIDEKNISTCSTLLVLESLAEIYGLPELYQVVAETSPFLERNMEDYFLGGLNDMVGWSHRIWDNGVTLLENGVSACTLPHNPLFINCKNSSAINKENGKSKNGFFVQQDLHGLTIDDLEIQRRHRGISIRPKDALKKDIVSFKAKRHTEKKKHQKYSEVNTGVYIVNSSYAKLGWAMATGDMDKDGYEDIVIGAPGYSVKGSPQQGKVYIVYGNDSDSGGFGYYDINLDRFDHFDYIRPTTLNGYTKKQSRFGSGLAVLDINLDGVLDLAVGSPSYYINSPLEYKGLVSIYLGKEKSRSYDHADITISCQMQYCNLGYNLEAGDVNGDGHDDLIMGLPFYGSKFNQSGTVAAVIASKSVPVGKTIPFESIKWRQQPDNEQPYSWFGFSVTAKVGILKITSPNVRKCLNQNCSYSAKDVQETGRADIFNYGKIYNIRNTTILGTTEYESAGYSLDFGYLYGGDNLYMAIGYPGMTVQGSYWTLPLNLTRAGSVIIYNMTTNIPTEVARFDGNRRYGGFGSLVKVQDINGDGIQDLLIGEPYRNKNKVEIIGKEGGMVYIFYGGSNFPKGNATFSSKCTLTKPCPKKIADYLPVKQGYDGGSNGYKAEVINTSRKEMVLFTSDIRAYAYFTSHNCGGVHHYYVTRT